MGDEDKIIEWPDRTSGTARAIGGIGDLDLFAPRPVQGIFSEAEPELGIAQYLVAPEDHTRRPLRLILVLALAAALVIAGYVVCASFGG